MIARALILLCTGLAAPASADPPRVRVVETLAAAAVVRDALEVEGDLLLATASGVVVRRGEQDVQTLRAVEGLPGSRTLSLSVTPQGVWVGAVEGTALITRRGDRWAVVRTLPLRRVRRAVRLGEATWLATFGDGLWRVPDGEGAAPERARLGRSSGNGRLVDLVADEDGLWIATSGSGILRVDAAGAVTSRLTSDQGLASNFVWDLHQDGGRLLAAGLGGVSVIRQGRVVADAPETVAARTLAIPDVRAVTRAGAVTLAGTWGGGIWRLGRERAVRVGTAAEAPRVHALVSSRSGPIAAHEGGGARLDVERGTLTSLHGGGLPTADVTALARAFGALWAGTFDRGLARIELDGSGNVRGVRWLDGAGVDGRVNDLGVTRDGRGRETLWVATDRGLYSGDGVRFDFAADPHAPGTTHTTSLHVDARGELWVTASRQLCRRRADGTWQSWAGNEQTPMLQLHAVTTDAVGRVWVGSLHGLFHFDPTAGTFTRHGVVDGALPVDWVTAVQPWNGGIVAGTYHGGLVWFDGRAFRIERERVRQSAALPSGWVNPHAMRWIGDTLFVGTLERGLAVGRAGRWSRLTTRDGLPSDDVTAVLPIDGTSAWVATRGGVVRVSWAG